MMVSTKGRYALRILIDLAEHSQGQPVPMHDMVRRQGLSQKYAERIMAILAKNHMVNGRMGKGGGYQLTAPAEQIRIGDVLRVTEGGLAPISCLQCDAETCERKNDCKTLPMWIGLDTVVNRYLDGITLADLISGTVPAV